jgi:nucleotide-binding universal stress UspA family protein
MNIRRKEKGMSADNLVMEARPVPAMRPPEPAGGPIRSILFAVHDDSELDSRFQAALSLARACSAHLQLLHVVPVQAYASTDVYGGVFVSGAIVQALEEEAEKIRERLEQHLRVEDVSWNYELRTSVLLVEMLQRAALADLVVMGRRPHWHEFSRTGPGLLGALICSARTPVCIPGDGRKAFDPFGKAVIAWNGSVEAANTVRSAIGLLKMASDVKVLRYIDDTDVALSDERLLQYLSRHGVHAELDTHLPKEDVAEDLIAHASRSKAEYLVMGGYSHSRAGEFLFGGVTRALLEACDLSLIMAH